MNTKVYTVCKPPPRRARLLRPGTFPADYLQIEINDITLEIDIKAWVEIGASLTIRQDKNGVSFINTNRQEGFESNGKSLRYKRNGRLVIAKAKDEKHWITFMTGEMEWYYDLIDKLTGKKITLKHCRIRPQQMLMTVGNAVAVKTIQLRPKEELCQQNICTCGTKDI